MKTGMKNTLIKYLRSLKRDEFIRFRNFLSDTSFQSKAKNSKRKRLIRLLELLEKNVLNKSKYDLTLQTKLYNELYADKESPTKKINTKQRNKLAANMTELTKLVERFLMYEALESDETCQIKLLGQQLIDKNEIDLWTRFERKYNRETEEHKSNDFSIIEKKLQFEILKLTHIEKTGELPQQDNLEQLMFQMDQYWLLKKFELYSTMFNITHLNPTKVYQALSSIETYFSLSKFYKDSKFPPSEFINLLYLNDTSLKLLQQPSEFFYNQMIKYLTLNKKYLTKDKLFNFFVQANNFCVFKIKQGQPSYSDRLLENYKTMENLGILAISKHIEFNLLLNIVKFSCDKKDFNWAQFMIDKYAPAINPKEQASAKDLLLCAFYFYKGNDTSNKAEKIAYYDKANEYITVVENKQIPFRLNYKILRVKLLYEIDKKYNKFTIPNFQNTIQAIRRIKELNDNHKKFSINFLRILILLYEYKHQVTTDVNLDKIKAKMGSMKAKNSGISNEQWLLEKIKELKHPKNSSN